MVDRELLELAAKAAGIRLHFPMPDDQPPRRIDDNSWDYWNPLTDDGDALRLAVKLSLWLSIGDTRHPLSASEASTEDGESIIESHSGDPYAATRRAIVRAAAEIGRNIEKQGDGGGV